MTTTLERAQHASQEAVQRRLQTVYELLTSVNEELTGLAHEPYVDHDAFARRILTGIVERVGQECDLTSGLLVPGAVGGRRRQPLPVQRDQA